MDPQEKVIYCCDNRKCEKKEKNCCLEIVFTILLAAFMTVIGIIIGAALSAAILAALPAIIVLAVILGLLLILTIILIACKKQKCEKKKCCH